MSDEPVTLARAQHDKHRLGMVEGCPYCLRRLEDSAESTAQQVMDFCTVHGEINCKELSCYRCGNHLLSNDVFARCTDPKCNGATRVLFTAVPGARLPERAYPDDAGLDLFANADYEIGPNRFEDVDLGLRMALPDGYWARITGRSSGFRRRGFMVIEGVIDAGYRGPLYAGIWNVRYGLRVAKGEKVAQMLIHRVEKLAPTPAEGLPESERGEKGFGSSGT